MKNADYLLISDFFSDGTSLSLSIAKELRGKIFLVASEHIAFLRRLIDEYDLADRVVLFATRPWEEGIYVINLLNLNDISIAISKILERNSGVFIFTIIPELLMIHGLEKTYMFLHNTITKIRAVNGCTLAVLNSYSVSKREEKILQKLFSNTIFIKRRGERREFYFEYPAEIREELKFEGMRADSKELLKILEKI